MSITSDSRTKSLLRISERLTSCNNTKYCETAKDKFKALPQLIRNKFNVKGCIVSLSNVDDCINIYSAGVDNALSNYRIGGQSIPIFSTLFLILCERGIMNMNDKLFMYVSNIPNGDKISLIDLLTMRAGLEDIIFVDDITSDPFMEWAKRDIKNIVENIPILHEPGKKFYFGHITNTFLIVLAMEAATGNPICELLNYYIWHPLGLENTSIELRPPYMRSYTNKRGVVEETTLWSTSWGYPTTLISSNAKDMNILARSIGTGTLLSCKSYRQFISRISCFYELGCYGLGVALGNITDDAIWSNQNLEGNIGIWCMIPSINLAVTIQVNTDNGLLTDEDLKFLLSDAITYYRLSCYGNKQ